MALYKALGGGWEAPDVRQQSNRGAAEQQHSAEHIAAMVSTPRRPQEVTFLGATKRVAERLIVVYWPAAEVSDSRRSTQVPSLG